MCSEGDTRWVRTSREGVEISGNKRAGGTGQAKTLRWVSIALGDSDLP